MADKTILQQNLASLAASAAVAQQEVAASQALRPTNDEIAKTERIIHLISDLYGRRISAESHSGKISESLKAEIAERVQTEARAITHSEIEYNRLVRLVMDKMFGLGPLEPFMAPGSTVTDIIIQRYNSICIRDDTGLHRVAAEFNSEDDLRRTIDRIVQQAGRQINLAAPAVDAKLPDGSRIHATIPPITPDGATLTIRRFNTRKLDGADYVTLGSMSQDMLDFLAFCIVNKISVIVSGGTDSGKTTLLNMLSSFIPDEDLIITIEDNCELQLRHPNVRRMEARQATADGGEITIQELVRHCLRMCPDRIVVGEIRDGTIVDMLSAMSVGHEGSMSTVHADSPRVLMDSRLPTLFSMYPTVFSAMTQALMISEAIQIVVQVSRERNHKRKVTCISATDGVDENNRVRLVDLYRYNRADDTFRCTHAEPRRFMEKLADKGIPEEKIRSILHLGREEEA